jgi:hypothetical protein
MDKLTTQEASELFKTILEDYANGLDDSGKEAAKMLEYVSLFEICKQCTRCGDILPESKFRTDNNKKSSKGAWCLVCDKENSRERRSFKHKPIRALEITLSKIQKVSVADTRESRFLWNLAWKHVGRIKNDTKKN